MVVLKEKQIEHVARLARLGLSQKEKTKLEKDFGSILRFVDQLKKVKTEGIEPIAQITGLENVTRPDQARPVKKKQRKDLLKLAPKRKGPYIKVKSIF